MRCVAVGATLSSLTSLISSIAIARLIAFSCLSLCVYILHTVCIMNMDGPLAKYIHSGQQIHIILCLCVCVFGGGPPLSLSDDLDLVGFYLSACGRLSRDAGHPERMRRSMLAAAVLYTNRWLDRGAASGAGPA